MPQDRIQPEREDFIMPFPVARRRHVTFAPAVRDRDSQGPFADSAAPSPDESPSPLVHDTPTPEEPQWREGGELGPPPAAVLPEPSSSQLTEEILRLREALSRMREENEMLRQSREPAPPYSSGSRSVSEASDDRPADRHER